MKKVILSALYILIGVFALTGCSENSEPFTAKEYTANAGDIAGVYVDVRDRSIAVALSADDDIHIQYAENSKEYYNISVSDNVLTMKAETSKDWTDYIGAKNGADSSEIVLQVPDGLLSTLHLSTTNEDVSLAPLNVTEDVSLSSNGGDIRFENLNAGGSITLDVKNGDISGSITGNYEEHAIQCAVKKGKAICLTKSGAVKKR